MWGMQALDRFISYPDVERVLDLGSGSGDHAKLMRRAGKEVTECDLVNDQDYNYTTYPSQFDGIWCSHVLEHQLNVNMFLGKVFHDLRTGGVLAITVPPAKHEIVGGHVTLWNQGLLLYNLILAGFDCSNARVSPIYEGYNISVIVRKKGAVLPRLRYDFGDIELLNPYWPFKGQQGFDGSKISIGW